jgi:hypothetical protein
MHFESPRPRSFCHLAATAFVVVSCSWANAQAPSAGEGQERLPLQKDWKSKDGAEELKTFQAMRRGELPITDANRPLIDRGAQWYAYRLTFSEIHEPKLNDKSLHDVLKEGLDQIVDPKATRQLPAALAQFKEEFDKRFVVRLHEVVKSPLVGGRVDATILLSRLAATGSEEAADVLAEIIKDPKENEAVKYLALQGLNKIFALGYGEGGAPMKNKEREARCIAALLAYVEAKPTLRAGAAPEEVAALGVVRREAVAALGETRYPAISKEIDKKTKAIDRMTALTLLKVMRNDNQPMPPSLGEQVAAAIGICHMQAKLLEEYNADYAAYQIGQFIIYFLRQYGERDPLAKKQLPWHTMAARLAEALNDLKNDGSDRESAKYVEKLCAQAQPLLQDLADKKPVREEAFRGWLEKNPCKNASLYKGVPTAVVNEATEKAGG